MNLRTACDYVHLNPVRARMEMAARVRRETTLTIKAIAARVSLGTAAAANRNLHQHMRDAATRGAGRRKARR